MKWLGLFIFIWEVTVVNADIAVVSIRSRCSAHQVKEIKYALGKAIEYVQRGACKTALREELFEGLLKRLRSDNEIVCANNMGSAHASAGFSNGIIYLKNPFFRAKYSSQIETIIHESLHALEANHDIDIISIIYHNSRVQNLPKSGKVEDIFWLKDPIYFCANYCANRGNPEKILKRLALRMEIGLRLKKGQPQSEIDAAFSALEHVDIEAHADLICKPKFLKEF